MINTFENNRPVGGNYFKIMKSRKSEFKLEHFLTFNPNDYYIYKSTRVQKEVDYIDFLNFKYASYIFFKKKLYDKENIEAWIDFSKDNGGLFLYLNKPVPPFHPSKLNIIE